MPFFESTAIERAEYDADSRTLRVWFTHGGEPYDYREVPPEVYAGLCSAASKGAYFNDHIRDRYEF